MITSLAQPLPTTTAGWSLFALGADVLLRVEPATGRVTQTELPPLSGPPVSLIPVRGRMIVQPPDSRQGYVVPDGAAATPSSLGGGPMFPGPDPDHVWAPVTDGAGVRLGLVTLAGASTGITFRVPALFADGIPDGGGGVVFEGIGGVYRADGADGLLRVSNGMLIALGPAGLVALECDEHARCTDVVRDRRGGARELPVVLERQTITPGWLSPDMTTAGVQHVEAGSFTVTLIDLLTGRQRRIAVSTTSPDNTGTAAWSPDSRWLFVINETGRVTVIDARTGAIRDLDRRLPPVTQLVIRP